MSKMKDNGGAIDRLFGALSKGDLAAAGDCLTDDVRVWHSFDRVTHDKKSILHEFSVMIRNSAERDVVDVRRQPTPSGFVQQHVFVMRGAAGHRTAWPVCIVATMQGGRIAVLEEYIDRAGHFAPT